MSVIVSRWLNVCCISVFIMILIGGATRLTQSGLSMVDWRPLMGVLPPLNHQQWEDSFNEYKKYPEYQKINQFKKMNLIKYKSIYYWEYAHRLFGRILGLLFIIPPLIFFTKGYISRTFFKHCLYCMLLIIFQGLLGWFMVKSGLVNIPSVSHYRLALHLSTALLLLSYTFWLYQVSGKNTWQINNEKIYRFSKILFMALCIQIIYGAFMSGLKAGFAAPTFPLINDSIIPRLMFNQEPFYSNFLNNKITIQFIHRALGFLILAMGIHLGIKLIKEKTQNTSKLGSLIIVIVSTQVILGIVTLLNFKNGVPILLASLHQFIAVVLLLTLLFVIIKCKKSDWSLTDN